MDDDYSFSQMDESMELDLEAMAIDSWDNIGLSSGEKMSYLNRVDYSLNSPLSVDEVREFGKYCNGHPYENRWNMSIWKLRKKYLNIQSNLRDPGDFHKWFGLTNRSIIPSLEKINSLLSATERDAVLTYEIVDAFFMGWINKKIDNPKVGQIPSQIRKWGALFLDFHYITLLLNANTLDEVKNLGQVLRLSRFPLENKDCISYLSPIFGDIRISKGMVFMERHSRLFDRSMILMLKDVYNARFHSLLSMINRADRKYTSNDWEKLNLLYSIGDNILANSGNAGYKCIKMIEPFCQNQLMKKAHQFRPKIVYYNNFQQHIDSTILELENISPLIRDLSEFIASTDSVNLLLTFFGVFRHWGHPFVNSLLGLGKLHARVTEQIKIDDSYANALASDLARKVLDSKFKEKSKWFVDLTLIPQDHLFYSHIESNTWPTPKQIKDFGDNWHKLPLMKCFEIPDLIDPCNIYSDKSHSMNRDAVLSHVRRKVPGSIPTKKVLETMINCPSTNWKEFLSKIDREGLDFNELIIGLMEKERELKEDGRFYSLMSWALREYFVVTEYLIKMHYVPLFKGLTVADDMTTLIKKMMDNSSGQGLSDYSQISYANHLDYEKWNNYQRLESNGPTFKVMGQFLGYPNLIYRTHEFFQKSLVYYTQRPDLMIVNGDSLENSTDQLVTWLGQEGGFEGIRQKGWSILNALSVERESKNLNTKVTLLAQGDNQIICTNYKLQPHRSEAELDVNLNRIKNNNDAIMKAIDEGVCKLGLRINRDETLQSADFLSYGKVPIFRGNIRPLEEKRWSRCSCVTNDQLPTLGNVISSVSSNALTIAHFSDSPINTIIHYNYVGNMIRNLLDIHNPATRSSIKLIKNYNKDDARLSYIIKSLYLDPCLGGVSGMSLTRFLIRMFPDPVTESLSFWKVIHTHCTPRLRPLISSIGHCNIATFTLDNFNKLLENPLSLNLKNSVSPLSKIKDVIRKALYERGGDIPNVIIKDAILYSKAHLDEVNSFLLSIDPLFPRFISEFKSSTYLGITESIIGLFENSRTIRNVFKGKMMKEIDEIIVKSELQSITAMHSTEWKKYERQIWDCSASQADALRFQSWGRPVIGATVPHPIELMWTEKFNGFECSDCHTKDKPTGHLTTLLPQGLTNYLDSRGPYMAYLGSRTSESTSIIQPWERENKIPLITRASKLRNVIHWFVEPNSKLAMSIFELLEGLTGENWDSGTAGFKRTGCGPHRYACSRQSSGGYSAQSPAKLTRMTTTTDTMACINEENHDFMYQSLILYAQITVGELHSDNCVGGIYHHHISCTKCLRTVKNPILDSETIFHHPNVSDKLNKWKPEDSNWAEKRPIVSLQLASWSLVPDEIKSYHLGRAEGFIFGDSLLSRSTLVESTALFPLGIANKVSPREFMRGLLDGILKIGSLYCLTRRSVMELKKPRSTLLGMALYLIESISLDNNMINIWRNSHFIQEFSTQPHRIPASYPLSNYDLGSLGRYYLKIVLKKMCIQSEKYRPDHETIWIFSDINHVRIVGSLLTSQAVSELLYNKSLKRSDLNKLRCLKDQIASYRNPDNKLDLRLLENSRRLKRVDSELRHAARDMEAVTHVGSNSLVDWSRESTAGIHLCRVNYTTIKSLQKKMDIPRIQDPLISGLRSFQCATGSHYKVRSIIINTKIVYHDVLCGGDGSGGVGSWLLRNNNESKLIFNSLFDLNGVHLKGSSPSGPSAIELIPEISDRCVNLTDVWKHPTDLSRPETWEYFVNLKKKHKLKLDLIVLDMEVRNEQMSISIINQLESHLCELLDKKGTVIFKTYASDIVNKEDNILNRIGIFFKQVNLIWTDYSSSHTSEVYAVMRYQSADNVFLTPDYDKLTSYVEGLPVFQSEQSEFQRAMLINKLNGFLGVPTKYHQDPFVHMSTLLMTLGVPTGVSGSLAEMIKYPSELQDPINYAFAILYVSLNSILNITQGHNSEKKAPGDPIVWNIGSLVIGFMFWLSLIKGDYNYASWAKRCIEYNFPFSWVCYKLDKWFKVKYSFFRKYPHSKNFHFDAEQARIGQIIRVFKRIFNIAYSPPNTSAITSILKSYDLNLSLKELDANCDINNLLSNPIYVMGGSDYVNLASLDVDRENAYQN